MRFGQENVGQRLWKRLRRQLMAAAAIAMIAAMAMPAHAGDDRAVKSRVNPLYPEIAKRMHIEGEVKLEATVDANGKVTDVKPVAGNQVLGASAAEAVKQWKFEPGDGVAKVVVSLNFSLK